MRSLKFFRALRRPQAGAKDSSLSVDTAEGARWQLGHPSLVALGRPPGLNPIASAQ